MADKLPRRFNPNIGHRRRNGEALTAKAMLPTVEGAFTIEQYASAFSKAIANPPNMLSFARMSNMPDQYNAGVIAWPGIPPESLQKVARENIAPQLIIGMRVADVENYSNLSSHPWKPGWRIELKQAKKQPSTAEQKDILAAQLFLQNCNTEMFDARKRDEKGLTSFRTFLASMTRDTLTYDGMAIWTDMDSTNRVKAFKALSASSIRLVGKEGYKEATSKFGRTKEEAAKIFAVGVDEMGNVVHVFDRDELTWAVRNPRLEPDIWGYGYSEIEVGARLIQGFQNALDLNLDVFDKNSVPNGILMLKGMGWTQRQLDVLSRMWHNLKQGVTKSWALPALAVPKDGDVEILDMTQLKGNEAYYQDLMNMVVGAFCTVYKFPVKRLGYRISGAKEPTEISDKEVERSNKDEDVGLPVLLGDIETVINEYLIWSRWPHLQFSFTGKNPKEDAREYEARSNAMTVGEKRAAADLQLMESMAPHEYKEIGKLMDLCPSDPALAGVYQQVLASMFGNGQKDEEARMSHKRDPAISEEHGHTSGVRRDSAAEAQSAEAGKKDNS